MRVAADQLLAHVLGDLGERPGAALLEQQRQEVDLEEHVAELVEQLGVVAAVRRVGQLVGLLERVRHDRALVLLAVPRALDAQLARQGIERRDRLGGVCGGVDDTRRRLPVLLLRGGGRAAVGRRRVLLRLCGVAVDAGAGVDGFAFGGLAQSVVW